MTNRKRKFTFPKNKQCPAHIARAKTRRDKRLAKQAAQNPVDHDAPGDDTIEHVNASPPQSETPSVSEGFCGFHVPPLKPSIRVLSLFDGIGTALQALLELGFHVDAYFASEIDNDAIEVVKKNFGDKPVMIGDIKQYFIYMEGEEFPFLKEEEMPKLGRIDLLVGGPPCSHLSKVNTSNYLHYSDPKSQTRLIDCYRIIRDWLSEKASREGYKFSWVMENTANMRNGDRTLITEKVGCEPIQLNGCHHLPAERDRLFWTNIPTSRCSSENPRLQDILPMHRVANFDKLRTITTNPSAQRVGKGKRLPISEDGKDVPLHVTEAEVVMGFPRSYTDAANLPATRRWRLLGKAFCVPSISHVLKPLSDHYWMKEENV